MNIFDEKHPAIQNLKAKIANLENSLEKNTNNWENIKCEKYSPETVFECKECKFKKDSLWV